ncbi:MAG: DUF302 domain-containing protein [Hyphomicrobiaceae bacterium]|nr:DUF302 domain-containing protein [Hyphomicrobiaceae bacterium]
MRFIWSLLAIIGLIALGCVGFLAFKFSPLLSLDKGAANVYYNMALKLAETGNAAEATIWKRQVADGISFDDVHESIKTIAQENNIKDVGFLPLGDQVGAMNGKPWRKLNIYLYCNPLTAQKMVDHSDAYAAYLPCRISLLEDKKGKLWIYSLDMDMMIHGGKTLPPALLKEAIEVKRIILDVLDRASAGDF